MALIKSKFITRKEEVVAVLPVAQSIDHTELYPYLFRLEAKTLKDLVDSDTLEDLELAYAAYVAGNYDENLLDVWETELLIRVQMALVNMAVRSWAPFATLNISSKGFTEPNGETKAARLATIELMLDAAQNDGNESIEAILTWLDENRAQYPGWENSAPMEAIFANYLVNAEDFSTYFNIGNSRYTFLRVQPQMKEAQRMVDRIIWEMGAELKIQQQTKALTSANDALLVLVKKAVANLTMVDALLMMSFQVSDYGVTLTAANINNRDVVRARTPVGDAKLAQIREDCKTKGAAALSEIRDLIYDNIDDYPTFSAGDHYTPDAPAPERFENADDVKIVFI